MKRRLLKGSLLALLLSFTTRQILGQGQIIFYNNGIFNPVTGAAYRAGIFQDNNDGIAGNSTIGAGGGFTAGLFLQSDPDADVPLATTTFRTVTSTEVFARFQQVTIPGVKPGERANLIVRVWDTSFGSCTAAKQWGGEFGEQSFQSQPLSDPFPPDMYPFVGFEMSRALTPLGGYMWGFEEWGYLEAWSSYNATNFDYSMSDIVTVVGGEYFKNGVPEGNHAAFILLNGPSTNEAGVKRVTRSVLAPRRRYTLKVEVGNPTGQRSNLNLAGFPGYQVALTAGASVLASDNNSLSIPEGEFLTSKVVVTSGDAHPDFGQSVRVRLVNLRQPGTPDAPGLAVAFDDVRFFDEPLQPAIAVHSAGSNSLELTWTDASETFTAETASDPGAASWQPLPDATADTNGLHHLQFPAQATAGFYRLRANP